MIAVAFAGFFIVCSLLMIAASLLRCRNCRGWHDSSEEQKKCEEEIKKN